jgi:hypothetical protein
VGSKLIKVALSFILGAVICLMGAAMVNSAPSAMADEITDNSTPQEGSGLLNNLIPDVGKIYRESLTEPFIKVKSEITDPEIAAYYDALMDKTGLTDPNSN